MRKSIQEYQPRILGLALCLAMNIATAQTSFARSNDEYVVVDEDEISTAKTATEVEEVEVVRPAKIKRKIIRERLVTENAAPEAVVPVAAPAPKEETFGERLSKKIDGRLEGNRRKYEDEMRRKQKEDEDRMISRLDKALTDEPAELPPAQTQIQPAQPQQPVQPQQQPLIQNQTIYSTVAPDATSESEEFSSKSEKSSNKRNFTIAPAFGMTHLSSSNYEIGNGTAVGLNLEFAVDENVSIDGGYTYAQHDITIGQNSYYYNGINNYYYNNYAYNGYLNNNLTKLEFNQNIFDLGMKYSFFDRSARIRPNLGAGGAYSKGYLNYPQQTINNFAQNPANNKSLLEDYEVSTWAAYFQAGVLLNLSESFGIGAKYRYYKVLSSNENTTINNYGFINNGYGYTQSSDKEYVGGSLKNSDFQTLGLSLNLTF